MNKRDEIIHVSEQELLSQRQFAEEFKALPDRPQTYFIVTYGCQMNAHDSEKLAGMLDGMGMTPAPRKEEADFVLHNTCCIRDNAERKAPAQHLLHPGQRRAQSPGQRDLAQRGQEGAA